MEEKSGAQITNWEQGKGNEEEDLERDPRLWDKKKMIVF